MAIRAFLVDDEPLAVRRLRRLIEATGRVEILGTSTDPVHAVEAIRATTPDVLFLDIQMPELTGFELVRELKQQPLVVFTTAYDQYALKAFEVNSIDYLLKPIEAAALDRALTKIERMLAIGAPHPNLQEMFAQIAAMRQPDYGSRLPSRSGDKTEFVELSRVTHLYAKDKLTFAATPAKDYVVDYTLDQLEGKLDPKKFVRVHRSTMLNIDYVHELHNWFGGRMLVRLKDDKRTEVTVSRERARELKERLGL